MQKSKPAVAAGAGLVTGTPKRRRRAPDLSLPAELGIDSAAALKQQLLGIVDRADAVVVDASAVQRVHSSALQLLYLFCRERLAAGRGVEFARPAAALRVAAELLGASTVLRLPEAAA